MLNELLLGLFVTGGAIGLIGIYVGAYIQSYYTQRAILWWHHDDMMKQMHELSKRVNRK